MDITIYFINKEVLALHGVKEVHGEDKTLIIVDKHNDEYRINLDKILYAKTEDREEQE